MINKLKVELWSWRIPYTNTCSITTKKLQLKLDNRKWCAIGEVEVEDVIT